MDDLQLNIKYNHDTLAIALKRSPTIAYQKVNELAQFVGSRYNVDLQLHFPIPGRISDLDSYGTENISLVVDKFRRVFPVSRQTVKQKAVELVGSDAKVKDAYTYEGKEGAKVIITSKGSIEVLPGSIHFWCKIDMRVKLYGDWMIENVYFPKNS
ncbi:MAG: hypothetical protein M3298_09680 [Thermoproteota archaeon]|nr:hypothetical protein [Thermoproteota archaeon]MDQ5843108.1 hypothetical protein [Thermoproteota archaeon]